LQCSWYCTSTALFVGYFPAAADRVAVSFGSRAPDGTSREAILMMAFVSLERWPSIMPKARSVHSPRKATPADMRIGRLIGAQRRAKGLTQTDLGNALGISFQTLQAYEKGVYRVPGTRLERIAKVLDMSLSDFFEESADRKGEMEILELTRSTAALRLLRAFNALKNRAARYRVLEMVEKMAKK
jgi:transcriptional regulator with XRE-family HTH domain